MPAVSVPGQAQAAGQCSLKPVALVKLKWKANGSLASKRHSKYALLIKQTQTHYLHRSVPLQNSGSQRLFSTDICVTKKTNPTLKTPKNPTNLKTCFHWTRPSPNERNQALIPSFKPICIMHMQYAQVRTCAPTKFSLLCYSSQLCPFSLSPLTSTNENDSKKLCNTKEEGLTFSLFLM